MIKKFEMTGSAEVKRRPGPTRKTTTLIDRIIVRKAKKDRRISAVKIQAQIKTEHSVDISESTVKRQINEQGMFGRNVLQSVKKLKLKKGWHYQHDNDPKHNSIVSRAWIIEKKIKVLQWAPYSPGLNPIEHLWSEVERQLKGRHPSNLEELEETVKETWYGMDPEICAKLVRSIPNRLRKVKKNCGYPTKY
ncbi:hypothetical protein RvY_12188 [Ramazzottius varieornatus]|uniref:Tc1-like transposase DDE domain-containing protein n=1 Tax=Ramazzottius varieornatus TaxID=947166 RepID=A0A1D1VIN6_RAMVA|nr:hypothetical protein RvY_12188 [Ramazzottius varieornatus]